VRDRQVNRLLNRKAEKQPVFPTLSAPIPSGHLLKTVSKVAFQSTLLFYPEKRQKEGTPHKNLRGVL